MAAIVCNSDEARRVDLALAAWRQGDGALSERWFIHVGDAARALTSAAANADEPGLQALTYEVDGLLMLTQTCDLVRDCTLRSFVEVCPLLTVDPETLESIRRGQRPNRVFVPGLADRRLVGDLDRVMTVEKSVVADCERTPGCETDDDARRLATALARKRARAAFPDDFIVFVDKLRKRMISKHAKDSLEGKALREIREIRVAAAPEWNAPSVEITFIFICDEEPVLENQDWAQILDNWFALAPPSGRFVQVYGNVNSLADLTAQVYVNSDPLDLEYLSSTS